MSNPANRSHCRSRQVRLLVLSVVLSVALLAGAAYRTPALAQNANHSAVFDNNCALCHQLAAAGVPGQFPRLAGRAGKIAATATGRSYLERLVLSGMIGRITVDGSEIDGGMMPPFASLSDQDLADALDYIVSLDDSGKLHWQGPMFKAADIAKARADKALSPTEVHQLRAAAVGKL